MESLSLLELSLGLLGGIIPAILWLWFWLHEDSAHPEPRKRIILAFVAGMIVVPLVIPFQKAVDNAFVSSTIIFILWAAIEEALKLLAAYLTGLSSKDDDEPIDPMIYLLTTALGFAALENALFILNPLANDAVLHGVITGSFRFIGATLVHVACSTAIGVALGLTFFKPQWQRLAALIIGLGIATGLHALFNLSIMNTTGSQAFSIFYFVWLAIVILALFFEKMKTMSRNTIEVRSDLSPDIIR